MEFFKLSVIFVMIMAMVLMKRQLRDAMIAAILLTVILLQIPIGKAAKMIVTSIYEKGYPSCSWLSSICSHSDRILYAAWWNRNFISQYRHC